MIMEAEKSHSLLSAAGDLAKTVVWFKDLRASAIDSSLDAKAWGPGSLREEDR